MRQIDGYPLWVGNARDARNLRAVLDAGIEAVVDLATEEPPAVLTRELVYLRFPLVDGADNPAWLVRATVETVRRLIRDRVPTLVACGMGLSRSPAVAAVALAAETGRRPDEALSWLMERRMVMDVTPGLWRDLLGTLMAPTAAAVG